MYDKMTKEEKLKFAMYLPNKFQKHLSRIQSDLNQRMKHKKAHIDFVDNYMEKQYKELINKYR